jgi:hypothetical protein
MRTRPRRLHDDKWGFTPLNAEVDVTTGVVLMSHTLPTLVKSRHGCLLWAAVPPHDRRAWLSFWARIAPPALGLIRRARGLEADALRLYARRLG